jgi:hypothetical protein
MLPPLIAIQINIVAVSAVVILVFDDYVVANSAPWIASGNLKYDIAVQWAVV